MTNRKLGWAFGLLIFGLSSTQTQAQFCERYGYIWNYCVNISNHRRCPVAC